MENANENEIFRHNINPKLWQKTERVGKIQKMSAK